MSYMTGSRSYGQDDDFPDTSQSSGQAGSQFNANQYDQGSPHNITNDDSIDLPQHLTARSSRAVHDPLPWHDGALWSAPVGAPQQEGSIRREHRMLGSEAGARTDTTVDRISDASSQCTWPSQPHTTEDHLVCLLRNEISHYAKDYGLAYILTRPLNPEHWTIMIHFACLLNLQSLSFDRDDYDRRRVLITHCPIQADIWDTEVSTQSQEDTDHTGPWIDPRILIVWSPSDLERSAFSRWMFQNNLEWTSVDNPDPDSKFIFVRLKNIENALSVIDRLHVEVGITTAMFAVMPQEYCEDEYFNASQPVKTQATPQETASRTIRDKQVAGTQSQTDITVSNGEPAASKVKGTRQKPKDQNCDSCGKHFIHTHKLNRHKKIHTEERLSCPVDSCPKTYKLVNELRRHIRLKHPGSSQRENG